MGKQQKRKGGNKGVGIDFKKVKHKVGKKLPKAQNETRTDFQSRSINLPTQSVTQEKAGAVVSDRNLTIQELLSQTSHHSEKVRKDALTGLQQLLTSHPSEARRHAAPLLEKLAARLSDGDASVRAALLQLLRAAALPALGATTLGPFLPMLMAHLEAAMTHLEASVRLDALGALEALAQAAPAAFAPSGGMLAPCLCHYAVLLSRVHRGRSVKAQALTGLAKVVASLRRFLAASLPGESDAADADVAAAASSSPQAAQGAGGGAGSGATAAQAAAAGAAAGGTVAEAATPPGMPLMARRCDWAPRPALLGPAQLLAIYAGPTFAQQQARVPAQAPQQQPPLKQQGKKRKLQEADNEQERPGGGSGGSGSKKGKPSGPGDAAAPAALAVKRGTGLAVAQEAAQQLLSSLASCWRECAPATLSTAPELEAAQALVDILACSSALLTGLQLLGSFSESDGAAAAVAAKAPAAARQAELMAAAAAALMPAVVGAFPVTAPPARPAAAVQELLVEFNVRGAQLLGSFLAAGVTWPVRRDKATPAELAWGGTLLRFIRGVLMTGVAVPASDALSASIAVEPLAPSPSSAPPNSAAAAAPATTLPLLRVAERLLPVLYPEDRQQLLRAVGTLAASAQQSGARCAPVRACCLRLQQDLLLRHLEEAAVDDDGRAGDMVEWLRGAPKALWGLGDKSPASSQVLLSMLYQTARLALPGSPLLAALSEAQPQLAPLLCTALPTQQQQQQHQHAAAASRKVQQPKQQETGSGKKRKKDKAKQQQQQQQQKQKQDEGEVKGGGRQGADDVEVVQPVLVGPLARLPDQIQIMGSDLISLLRPLNPALVRSLALACRLRCYPERFVMRLLDGVLSGAPSSMGVDVYLQLLATLLCPRPGAVLARHGAGKQQQQSQQQRKRRREGQRSGEGEEGVGVDGEGEGEAWLDGGFERHVVVVDCVCRWMHRFGPPEELAAVLEDCLGDQWEQHLKHRERAQLAGVAAGGVGGSGGAVAGCEAHQRLRRAEEGVRSVAYSIVSVSALAAGCWVAPKLTAAAAAQAAAAAVGGNGGVVGGQVLRLPGDEGGADVSIGGEAARRVPPRLLQLLPAAMAEQLEASVGAALQGVEAEEAASSDAAGAAWARAAAAAEAAASVSAAQLLVQVLLSMPELALPFLELIVSWAAGTDQQQRPQQQQQQQQQQVAPSALIKAARLTAAAEAMQVVFTARPLLPWWLQHEQQVQRLSGRLAAAAAALQEATGDARCVARRARLNAAVTAVYAK